MNIEFAMLATLIKAGSKRLTVRTVTPEQRRERIANRMVDNLRRYWCERNRELPNPRNQPCACGSGLKVKRCHGLLARFEWFTLEGMSCQ